MRVAPVAATTRTGLFFRRRLPAHFVQPDFVWVVLARAERVRLKQLFLSPLDVAAAPGDDFADNRPRLRAPVAVGVFAVHFDNASIAAMARLTRASYRLRARHSSRCCRVSRCCAASLAAGPYALQYTHIHSRRTTRGSGMMARITAGTSGAREPTQSRTRTPRKQTPHLGTTRAPPLRWLP